MENKVLTLALRKKDSVMGMEIWLEIIVRKLGRVCTRKQEIGGLIEFE